VRRESGEGWVAGALPLSVALHLAPRADSGYRSRRHERVIRVIARHRVQVPNTNGLEIGTARSRSKADPDRGPAWAIFELRDLRACTTK